MINEFVRRDLKLFRSTAIQLVAAAVTLFTNILDDPLAESVTEDLAGVGRVVDYLRLGAKGGCPGVSGVFLPTDTLYNMAAQTVARFRSGIGVGVVDAVGPVREVYTYLECSEG